MSRSDEGGTGACSDSGSGRRRLSLTLKETRGVNEVLAFALILSIVLGTVFLGATLAADQFSSVSDDQLIQFAEEELSSIQRDVYEVSGGAPYRSSDVSLPSGTFGYAQRVEMSVTVTAPRGDSFSVTRQPRPLMFDGESGDVYLSGGAVLLAQNGGGRMVSGPRMTVRENQSLLAIIETRQAGSTDQVTSGSGGVTVVSHQRNRETNSLTGQGGSNVTVEFEVTSPRYELWRDYFESRSAVSVTNVDSGANTVTAEFETREVVVIASDIDTKFGSPEGS